MRFLFSLLLFSSALFAQEEYYSQIYNGVYDAQLSFYGTIPTFPGTNPVAPSAGNQPLQDISSSISTSSSLTYSSNNLMQRFGDINYHATSFGNVADSVLGSLQNNLPSTSGTLSSYSFGTFQLGGRSVELNVNFEPFASSIQLVRSVILVVMTVGFCLTMASTVRGYL
ncbi:MAG: hypothetical protein NTV12_07255 [Verrucomicrobia bacterium]|nr:hypothetical protein [Verrucomicrobiota bacterium]